MERHNPLLDPRPDDPVQQIRDYARDLAYRVVYDPWDTITVENPPLRFHEYKGNVNSIEFCLKWGGRIYEKYFSEPQIQHLQELEAKSFAARSIEGREGNLEPVWEISFKPPIFELLIAYEYAYLTIVQGKLYYNLSQKAFALLEKPDQPPFIFISYRRMESSAFALLIESRLRFVGIPNVFIDKNIDAGTQWEQEIEAQVRQCKTFIVLIGPETLKSPMVRKEIQWAEKQGARIIPIWHNGHALEQESDCPTIISASNDIRVEGLAAKHYETAINELLNTLGYRTY